MEEVQEVDSEQRLVDWIDGFWDEIGRERLNMLSNIAYPTLIEVNEKENLEEQYG